MNLICYRVTLVIYQMLPRLLQRLSVLTVTLLSKGFCVIWALKNQKFKYIERRPQLQEVWIPRLYVPMRNRGLFVTIKHGLKLLHSSFDSKTLLSFVRKLLSRNKAGFGNPVC